MKSLFTLLAIVLLFAGPAEAADKTKGSASAGNLKYVIEYGKIPGKLTLASRIKPSYPKELRAAGVQGDVIVSFVVEGDGRVGVAHGDCPRHPELARLAEAAVKRWKFGGIHAPLGAFTAISTSVKITFRLLGKPPEKAP